MGYYSITVGLHYFDCHYFCSLPCADLPVVKRNIKTLSGEITSPNAPMTTEHLADERFLHLLRERRKKRAAALSNILSQPQQRSTALERLPSPHPRYSELSQRETPAPTNLSTHYLFSSTHPQNEIQNPYPNCFEGYPKLQRYTCPDRWN